MTSADAPAVPPIAPHRDRALGIIATATLLALLYFARDVLVPVTLAFILSLLIAPLVRALRRIGLGQTVSVLAAVFVLALSFGAVAGVIGSQLVHMSGSVPQYERTLEDKLETLNRLTLRRVNAFTAQAGRLLNKNPQSPQPQMLQSDVAGQTPIPVELHEARQIPGKCCKGCSGPSGFRSRWRASSWWCWCSFYWSKRRFAIVSSVSPAGRIFA